MSDPNDPLSPSFSDALAMTHWPDDPRAAEVARRLQRTGQNLWNTWGAPVQAAKQLGQAATSGTLDVTNPQTAGQALNLVSGMAGGRAPFAGAGELGSAGGKIPKAANINALPAARNALEAEVTRLYELLNREIAARKTAGISINEPSAFERRIGARIDEVTRKLKELGPARSATLR